MLQYRKTLKSQRQMSNKRAGLYMIEITGYENIGKGKYRTTFDNGTTCVLYRTEAVRYSIMEGAFISEADYEKLITEVVGKRAKKESTASA